MLGKKRIRVKVETTLKAGVGQCIEYLAACISWDCIHAEYYFLVKCIVMKYEIN